MKKLSRNEIIRRRYHILRAEGYSAKEANRLKHHSMNVKEIQLRKRKNTEEIFVVNNKAYRTHRINSYIEEKKSVHNDSVYSNWGFLTQIEPHSEDTMKMARMISKRDKESLDYGYYYVYFMLVNGYSEEEMERIKKTDPSFEIYKRKKR